MKFEMPGIYDLELNSRPNLPHVFLHQGHVTLFVGPDEYVVHSRPPVDGAGGAQVASTVVHAVPRPHLGGHFL
ncbi:hypothetical protein B296_00005156 [Ensete ventricosum]|uniref:Uncharacterized protein n=1 Tax=Ensete ventricosum TaxID=4639 RepID=A0A427AB58_ENSVE|nr:hypothetical protein B296_00005156 [Ensete ventricosum]